VSDKFAVPYQNNCSDCGVFVCRYAYAMYELARRTPITCAFARDLGQLTDSDEFDFCMMDIARIREEMKTLIRRLTNVYTPWKEAELQREKEEKAERTGAPRRETTKTKGSYDADSPDDQSEELDNPIMTEPCSDLATTETSTASGSVTSNGVRNDSPLSPGGVSSATQEKHDPATAEASITAISNDGNVCTSSSPCYVPSERHDCHDQTAEASKGACGTLTSRHLSISLSSPNGVPSDVQEGVSYELSSLSSTLASEDAVPSNLPCLRHPGDPGLAAANPSSAMSSTETGVPCTPPQPMTAIYGQYAASSNSGSADPSTVLKDVENQTARATEFQKSQPSLQLQRLSVENLNAATSPKSECTQSTQKGTRDPADHRVGGCTSLHISSSPSSESNEEREEDHRQDDTPDCEMVAAAVNDDEADVPDDLFPSSSAFEPMERIDSVQRGVASLTTSDDSTMDTS
jgi:hypothetical protein